jgi:hypothetical protein
VAHNTCAPNLQRKETDFMLDSILNNSYLHGIRVLFTVEIVLAVLTIYLRKPGASRLATLYDSSVLTVWGSRMKVATDVVWVAGLIWIAVAVVVKQIVG